jgi:sirohydrochlorin ferrochelatase
MSEKTRTAIILIGHGSRVPASGSDMEKVAVGLRNDSDHVIIETCYMSRMKPFFSETLKKVIDAKVDKVMVIPYFLHSGLHLVLDIPKMIQENAEKYPDVKIVYGKHLGYDDAMVTLVKRRIEESETLCDVRDLKLAERENYPLPNDELEFIPMTKEEAKEYTENRGGHCHHH